MSGQGLLRAVVANKRMSVLGTCVREFVEPGTYRVAIRTNVLLPSVGPAVQDVVSFFAAGSKVESLFKIARQAGVARIRARLPTVLR